MNHCRKKNGILFLRKKQAKKTGEFVLQSKRRTSWGSLCQMFFHRIERGLSPKCWLPMDLPRLNVSEESHSHLWDENCWTEENHKNHSISGSCCCWALEKSMIFLGILFSSRDPSPTNCPHQGSHGQGTEALQLYQEPLFSDLPFFLSNSTDWKTFQKRQEMRRSSLEQGIISCNQAISVKILLLPRMAPRWGSHGHGFKKNGWF